MLTLPRAQTIIALVSITVVVVITLIGVNVAGRDSDSAAEPAPTVDPSIPPTPVPILERERLTWNQVAPSIRGASGTRAPVACPFVDERQRDTNEFLSLTPALTFICADRGLSATPIAPGRVVMAVAQAPLNSQKAALIAYGKDGPWIRAATYGHFVAIDHGPLNGVPNVTTIYAGLESIDPALRVGQEVGVSTRLGVIGARTVDEELVNGVLSFELLSDDTRFGGDPLRASPPPASVSTDQASLLAPYSTLPVTTCTLPFGNPELLVGAEREYRSGIHNGLDFNCNTTDHDIASTADGEVLFVVTDYVDPSVGDRDAVLANAAIAIDTPFWTLAMLYGNFVVVAHHLEDSDDRIVSIYAHLTDVDPNIVTGRMLAQGDRIGTVGNTGTSAAAAGITENHTSIHLHWELHVNDRPVGYLQDPADTEPLYVQMLCGPLTLGDEPLC